MLGQRGDDLVEHSWLTWPCRCLRHLPSGTKEAGGCHATHQPNGRCRCHACALVRRADALAGCIENASEEDKKFATSLMPTTPTSDARQSTWSSEGAVLELLKRRWK
jgi:hypothetical protein